MSLKARIARLEATTPPAGRPPELVVSDPRTGITVLGYPGDFASVDDALDWLYATLGEPACPDVVLRVVAVGRRFVTHLAL